MELCIFVGLQATGKSIFFHTRFAATHVYVSKDTFHRSKTMNKTTKQLRLVETALQEGKSVVVDNTNPTQEDRAPLIALGHSYGAKVIGYFFQSSVQEARRRNSERIGKARVPDVALYTTAKKLVPPTYEEGFDALWRVRIEGNGRFEVVARPQYLQMSVASYLALEQESEELRYEYIDGYAYLLAGGTPAHSLIAANLIAEIKPQLRGGPCRVYTSEVKVRLAQSRYVYPDVVVSCDERDEDVEAVALQYPRLVVEILSPSTEAYDRGNKSDYYRACPSIQEYVMVSTQRQLVEVYRRVNDKLWTLYPFEFNENVELTSIQVTLPIATIYENVRLL